MPTGPGFSARSSEFSLGVNTEFLSISREDGARVAHAVERAKTAIIAAIFGSRRKNC